MSIKAAVISALCLTLIDNTDESKSFFLNMDASPVTLFGVLTAKNTEGWQTLAFHGWKFNIAVANYCTTE